MTNRSSIDCVADNKIVLVTGCKATTFFLLREGEQCLLEKKLDRYSARVISDHVLDESKYPHKDGLKSLVSLVREKLSCRCGSENKISSKPIHIVSCENRMCHKISAP